MAGKPKAGTFKDVLAMGMQELDLDNLTVDNLTVLANFDATTATWSFVPCDNQTIEFLISAHVIRVKPGGIGTIQLANGAVTNAKIVDVDWSKIINIPALPSAVVDNTTVEIVTGILGVKNVPWSKITGAPPPYTMPDPLTLNWGLAFNIRPDNILTTGLALQKIQRYNGPDLRTILYLNRGDSDYLYINVPQPPVGNIEQVISFRRRDSPSAWVDTLSYNHGLGLNFWQFQTNTTWEQSSVTPLHLDGANMTLKNDGFGLRTSDQRGIDFYAQNSSTTSGGYSNVYLETRAAGTSGGTDLHIRAKNGSVWLERGDGQPFLQFVYNTNGWFAFRSMHFTSFPSGGNNNSIWDVQCLVPRDTVGDGLKAGFWNDGSRTDYRAWRLGGGNNYGYIYGNHPAHGDGINISYNYCQMYRVSGGAYFEQPVAVGAGSSRIRVGYDGITFHTISAGGSAQNVVLHVRSDQQYMNYYHGGNGSGTTLTINGNVIRPSSSSLRYKENVIDVADEIDTSLIYKLRPVAFNYIDDRKGFEPNRMKCPMWTKEEMDAAGIPAEIDGKPNPKYLVGQIKPCKPEEIDTYNVSFGLIAEEVEKVPGGEKLCFFNEKKEVDSIQYNEVMILMLAEVQKMAKTVDMLTNRVEILERENAFLKSKLSTFL